jgi:hypothetical protein
MPTTEVTNRPKQRRIIVCMEKDEDGGAEFRCEKQPMECG